MRSCSGSRLGTRNNEGEPQPITFIKGRGLTSEVGKIYRLSADEVVGELSPTAVARLVIQSPRRPMQRSGGKDRWVGWLWNKKALHMEAVPLPAGVHIAAREDLFRQASKCLTRGDLEEGKKRNSMEMARAHKTTLREQGSAFHGSLILSLLYG